MATTVDMACVFANYLSYMESIELEATCSEANVNSSTTILSLSHSYTYIFCTKFVITLPSLYNIITLTYLLLRVTMSTELDTVSTSTLVLQI